MYRSIALLCTLLPGLAAALELPRELPVPGGLKLVALDSRSQAAPRAEFAGAPVLTLHREGRWWAVVGLPLSLQPGPQTLRVRWGEDGPRGELSFRVRPKEYAAQYITLENKRQVNPNAEDLRRIRAESALMAEAKRRWSDTPPQLPLLRPTAGPDSSPFGLRRFFNQQPRRPHGGLDIAAPRGTPILAPAPGEVILTGDFFFNGKTVFLDHGRGLITFYAHMEGISVRQGQRVAAGETIGAVGSTGRATGPHLHWGVQLNRTWVDPSLFLAADG